MKKIIRVLFVAVLISIGSFVLCACNSDNDTPSSEDVTYPVYTIMFDTDGGSEIAPVQSDSKTGKISRPEDPQKPGYTFIDWFPSGSSSIAYNFDSIVTADMTLRAVWERDTLDIVFDGNGSTSGDMLDVTAKTGDVIRLPKNKFERTGYSFIGWSSSREGSAHTPDAGYYVAEGEKNSVITLYAIWEANIYSVTLDAQGGTTEILNINAIYDSFLSEEIPAPERAGYYFLGYYTEPNGAGDQYYDKSMMPVREYYIADDIVLYAYWASIDAQLMFDGNGNTIGATPAIGGVVDAVVSIPENGFIRTGYLFEEWNSAADGSGISYKPGDEYVLTVGGGKLFAIWQAISYTVEFKDESGCTQSQSFTYDEQQALMLHPFSKEGHTFLGWSLVRDDSTISFANGEEVINLSSVQDAIIVLYAVWQANTYSLSFDKQNGFGGTDSIDVIFGCEIKNIQIPIRDGYVFGGYFDRVNGSGRLYINSEGFGTEIFDKAYDVVLFAYWIPMTNVMKFVGNGATSGTSDEIIVQTDAIVYMPECGYSRLGYEFIGWNTEADGSGIKYSVGEEYKVPVSDEPLTFYAIWKAKIVQIIFNPNGAEEGHVEAMDGVSDGIIILPENLFLHRGYTFVGWSDKSTQGKIFEVGDVFEVRPSDEPIALYAVWKAIVYSIEYNLDGGENAVDNPFSYTIEDSTIVLNEPTMLGYTFKGWKEGNTIESGSIGNRTFTALWEVINYRISYVLNGGENSRNNPISYTVEDEIVLESPIKTGASFLGWKEGNIIPKGSIGDKTFTATWEGTLFNVIYDLGGGINNPGNPSLYTYEECLNRDIVLLNPTREGYTFKGWTPSDRIEQGSTGDKYFTALWEINVFEITYELNGGVNSTENPSSYTMESDTIYLQSPTKTGYIFLGWKEGDMIEHGSSGDKHFTATWEIIEYSIIYDLAGGVNHPDNPASYTIESEEIHINDPTREGYDFAGWADGSDTIIPAGSSGEKFLQATWTVKAYNITYVLGGSDVKNDNPATYTIEDRVVFSKPERNGYKFLGWSDANGDAITEIIKGSTGDISITAQWEIERYNILYDTGVEDEEIINYNPASYTVEDNIVFNGLERLGYKFLGWQDSTGATITEIIKGSTGDISITAQWEIERYNILYDTGVEDEEIINDNPASYTVEDNIVFNGLERLGYKFLGWFDENGEIVTGIVAGTTGDIFVTAKWEIIVYTISYDTGISDEDILNENLTSYTVEDEVVLFGLTREGYTFIGWQNEQGETITTIKKGTTGDVYLIACWETMDASL